MTGVSKVFTVTAELPGMSDKDIDLSISGDNSYQQGREERGEEGKRQKLFLLRAHLQLLQPIYTSAPADRRGQGGGKLQERRTDDHATENCCRDGRVEEDILKNRIRGTALPARLPWLRRR